MDSSNLIEDAKFYQDALQLSIKVPMKPFELQKEELQSRYTQ